MSVDDEEEVHQYGKHGSRRDIERTGFFDDPPPGPFEEYRSRAATERLRDCLKTGRQMLCRQPGDFFDKKFKRIFTGEALPELGLGPKKKKTKKKEKVKRYGEVIIPPGTPKHHSTPGDWFGCIGRQPKHFSPELKPMPKKDPIKTPANFHSKPSKVGGPGYIDICLNPYLPMYYGKEPYDPEYPREPVSKGGRRYVTTCGPAKYFDENPYRRIAMQTREEVGPRGKSKLAKPRKAAFWLSFPGAPYGPNSGCFSAFPKYICDPEVKAEVATTSQDGKPPLQPVGGPASRAKFTTSIVDRVTKVACNASNYFEYRERVYPLR